MSVVQAVILGIIQGLTEFLPVSSSGHLVLFQKIFGIRESTLVFDTFLHVGTLLAVIAVFRKDIASILRKPFQKLTWLLLAGTIPTALIGVLFKDYFEELFKSGRTLGLEFILTGAVLLYAERLGRGRKALKETTYLDAAFIGMMQGAAILPAVSRSGLTIAGSLFRNLDREFAARFSFLLSIPAILGAAVFQFKDVMEAGGGGDSRAVIIAGTIAAAVAGYASVKFMIELIKKKSMKYFAYYVFLIGALVLADQYFTHIFF